MPADARDYLLLALPWPLFYIAFNLAPGSLVLAMCAVSSCMAGLAAALKPSALASLKPGRGWVLASLLGSVTLYLVFVAGGLFSRAVGAWWQVLRVYSSLERSPLELLSTVVVGFAEEVYWRGYVQEHFISRQAGRPWWCSAIPYSLVHIVSGLPLLVLAAAPVGLIMGWLAKRWGVACSAAAHALWLVLVLYAAPVPAVLGA